uniref:Uncharacterized protein n=1 Tax=Lotharella oceanica TaxID=641309 RepID=A0A7S2TY92_9EUKA
MNYSLIHRFKSICHYKNHGHFNANQRQWALMSLFLPYIPASLDNEEDYRPKTSPEHTIGKWNFGTNENGKKVYYEEEGGQPLEPFEGTLLSLRLQEIKDSGFNVTEARQKELKRWEELERRDNASTLEFWKMRQQMDEEQQQRSPDKDQHSPDKDDDDDDDADADLVDKGAYSDSEEYRQAKFRTHVWTQELMRNNFSLLYPSREKARLSKIELDIHKKVYDLSPAKRGFSFGQASPAASATTAAVEMTSPSVTSSMPEKIVAPWHKT